MSAYTVFGLVSSVSCQVIGVEEPIFESGGT